MTVFFLVTGLSNILIIVLLQELTAFTYRLNVYCTSMGYYDELTMIRNLVDLGFEAKTCNYDGLNRFSGRKPPDPHFASFARNSGQSRLNRCEVPVTMT